MLSAILSNSSDKLTYEGIVAAVQKAAYIKAISEQSKTKITWEFQNPLVYCAHLQGFECTYFAINLLAEDTLQILEFPDIVIDGEESLQRVAILHIRLLELMDKANTELQKFSKTDWQITTLHFWNRKHCTDKCDQSNSGNMIQCDKCKRWYHPAHIGMPQEEFKKYEGFLCLCIAHSIVEIHLEWKCPKCREFVMKAEAEPKDEKDPYYDADVVVLSQVCFLWNQLNKDKKFNRN